MSYIFNKNHNRTHLPGCRAVSMMNRDQNEVPVDEPRGHSCKWCNPGYGGKDYSLQTNLLDEEICTDPEIREVFRKAGCISCHEHLGDINMYPHNGGIEVPGHQGKWWVYFTCFNCGYETAYWKALRETQNHGGEPVKVTH